MRHDLLERKYFELIPESTAKAVELIVREPAGPERKRPDISTVFYRSAHGRGNRMKTSDCLL